MPAFTGFAPDVDPTTEGVITNCSQLIPTLNGMAGAPALIDAQIAALTGDCIGAASITLLDGSRKVVAGDADYLYVLATNAWTDISRATVYTTAAGDRWRFAQFGNAIVAANNADLIQVATSGNFANIADAPKAKYLVTAAGFVVAFGINDARVGGSRPDAWWCSGLYDHATWTPAPANLAEFGYLMDTPGAITGAKRFGNAIIAYKANAIYIGEFVDSTVVWRWNAVQGEIGAVANDCIVDAGTSHLFIGTDDFYLFNGAQPVAIGSPVREWFFKTADEEFLCNTIGVFDRKNNRVWWFFSAKGNNGALTDALVYHLKANKWGYAKYSAQTIFQYITPDLTYDAWPPGAATTYDNIPDVTYDSVTFNPGGSVISLVAGDKKIYTLDGVSASASITTGEFGSDEQYSTLTGVIPRFLSRPTTSSMTHYTKEYLDGDESNNGSADLSGNRYDALWSGRHHNVRFDFTGDFEMVGFTPKLVPDGSE